MIRNDRGGRRTPRDSVTRGQVPGVPQPRTPDSSPSVGCDREDPDDRNPPLLSARELLILMISLLVGMMSGAVSGLTVAAQAVTALGSMAGVALGIIAGMVALVITGLAVATSLHKLLR